MPWSSRSAWRESQQCGAGALSLPVRADCEDGQVVVEDPGRMVPVELLVEGQEPV